MQQQKNELSTYFKKLSEQNNIVCIGSNKEDADPDRNLLIKNLTADKTSSDFIFCPEAVEGGEWSIKENQDFIKVAIENKKTFILSTDIKKYSCNNAGNTMAEIACLSQNGYTFKPDPENPTYTLASPPTVSYSIIAPMKDVKTISQESQKQICSQVRNIKESVLKLRSNNSTNNQIILKAANNATKISGKISNSNVQEKINLGFSSLRGQPTAEQMQIKRMEEEKQDKNNLAEKGYFNNKKQTTNLENNKDRSSSPKSNIENNENSN